MRRSLRLPVFVLPCAAFALILLGSQVSLAESADSATQPATAAPEQAPACALLVSKLRWHQPFFGLRTWSEVASEALAHASAECREAIASGRAKEVAGALTSLQQHAETEAPQLARFVYRLTCKLRVPEARSRILSGVHEPAVFADCADALFAMEWQDAAAQKLREQYIEGLCREPLTTPVPPAILKLPFVLRLAPVLRAYDSAKRPGRDAIYRALCEQPAANKETETLCAQMKEREPEWVSQKLLDGDLDAGFSHLVTLLPRQSAQFAALLQRFDAEKRPGRDRLYGLLCTRQPPQAESLRTVCNQLGSRQEARWAAQKQAELVQEEVDAYYLRGRFIAGLLLTLALCLIGHRLLCAPAKVPGNGLRGEG